MEHAIGEKESQSPTEGEPGGNLGNKGSKKKGVVDGNSKGGGGGGKTEGGNFESQRTRQLLRKFSGERKRGFTRGRGRKTFVLKTRGKDIKATLGKGGIRLWQGLTGEGGVTKGKEREKGRDQPKPKYALTTLCKEKGLEMVRNIGLGSSRGSKNVWTEGKKRR